MYITWYKLLMYTNLLLNDTNYVHKVHMHTMSVD